MYAGNAFLNAENDDMLGMVVNPIVKVFRRRKSHFDIF